MPSLPRRQSIGLLLRRGIMSHGERDADDHNEEGSQNYRARAAARFR